jgi:phage gpG-like protein
MASAGVEIAGMDKIQARLDKLMARNFTGGSTDVVKLWGLSTENIAKMLCPVDTGRLRSSIAFVRISETEGLVGTPVSYGPFIEYGTCHMDAHPFLRPAFFLSYNEILSRIKAFLAEQGCS